MMMSEGVQTFHMRDFEHFHGEYKDWTPERHRTFLSTVVGYLTSLPIYFVGVSVLLRETVPLIERFGKGGDPYYLLFQMALTRFGGSVHTIPPQQVEIDFVVAEHPEHSRHIANAFERVRTEAPVGPRLASLTIGSPRDVSELQAADLVAYETMKYHTNEVIDGSRRPTRWPMAEIGRTNRYLIAYAKVEDIIDTRRPDKNV